MSNAYDQSLRFIERCGQLVLTGTIVFFVVMGVMFPEPYAKVWQLVLTHMVTGRAGNVGYGLELGFSPLFLLFQCSVQDLIILLLCYPLIVAGYRKAVEWPYIGSTLEGIRQSADKHKSKIEPYGVVGLMVFVIFPFWSTGPLVGAVVGFLIGMRNWVAFTAVTLGNVVAVALWVFLFQRMRDFNERLTNGILISILVVVLVSAIVFRVRRLRRVRRRLDQSGPSEGLSEASSDGHKNDSLDRS
tara:strand:+ start:454 stop:1185 length:732 start_codon:yes stop_codon:yes gene_type:complete